MGGSLTESPKNEQVSRPRQRDCPPRLYLTLRPWRDSCATAAASSEATEPRFREIYKELVETNTSLSVGSCTLAAERMAARLKAAGYPDEDFHPFSVPDHPKEGGLVLVSPGRDPKLKAILLLAHIDVVEAKREDWVRDPFKLAEENGNFYARGTMDDKAEALSGSTHSCDIARRISDRCGR